MKKSLVIKKVGEMGVGVFTDRSFHKGSVVVVGRLVRKLSKRTSHSFQIGPGFHVQLDKLARSINHSCNPNTGVRNNFYGGYNFVALRDIKVGEEITWDYETTEFISISVVKCFCGSKHCRKKLKGFKFHPKELSTRYKDYIADYLKERYTLVEEKL